MASPFWNKPLFGGSGQQQSVSTGHISKSNNIVELIEGLRNDLEGILELEAVANNNVLNGEVSGDTATVTDIEENATLLHTKSLAARLARIKSLLYEETVASQESKTLEKSSKFAAGATYAFYTLPALMPKLLKNLPSISMPFESRKDVAAIFNNLMVRHIICQGSSCSSFAHYVLQNYDEILSPILLGHGEAPDIALHCGSMLRSTLRHQTLYQRLLSTCGDKPTSTELYVYPLLDTYVHLPNFDVSSDALATVREIFLTSRVIAAEFLERDYDNIFQKYNITLQSKNYITRRLSLKLLVEILLDRSNFNIMIKYISSRGNLRIVMLLLSDPSPNIQFEAFHVFKIFVANPDQPDGIKKVLMQNKEKLIKYLENFHVEREKGDEQFREERGLIISTLNRL